METSLITTKSLATTEQIENEFCIYFSEYHPHIFKKNYFYIIEKQKEIASELRTYIDIGRDIFDRFNSDEDDYFLKQFPKRYRPTIIKIKKPILPKIIQALQTKIYFRKNQLKKGCKITRYKYDVWGSKHIKVDTPYEDDIRDYKKEIKQLKEVELYKMVFKTQIISFMEQKKIEPKVVSFFKELTKLEGEPFEVYINNWTKRLIGEMYVR